MPSNTFLRGLFLRPKHAFFLLLVFFINTIGPLPSAQAHEFFLPTPGVMVPLSLPFNPPILKGIKVHPENPFRFDFILDKGDVETQNFASLRKESTKLIKYFLASLTIPENDLWVNLSPYERNRIIPRSFGFTEMGRDLLAEDYMLKQITASLIYPEGETGKKFWKRIYAQAAQQFGTTNIPVNTFNKVWIIPEKAVVYENAKAGTAYVVESKLKVMLEQDYLAMGKDLRDVMPTRGHVPPPWRGYVSPSTLPTQLLLNAKASQVNPHTSTKDINALGSQVVRAIVIPELTKEVNEGQNFTQLRQVYNSLILATWYKKKIKDSILAMVYEDKKKVVGIQYENSVIPKYPVILSAAKNLKTPLDSSPSAQNDKDLNNEVQLIYQRYLQAFKKGAYNYIKEDVDPLSQQPIPRKYFSGGTDLAMGTEFQVETNHAPAGNPAMVQVNMRITTDVSNAAMSTDSNLLARFKTWAEEGGYSGIPPRYAVSMAKRVISEESELLKIQTNRDRPTLRQLIEEVDTRIHYGRTKSSNPLPDNAQLTSNVSKNDGQFSIDAAMRTSIGSLKADAPIAIVVDDDPKEISKATKILERKGFHVISFETCEAALKKFAEGNLRIDLIVSDLHFPHGLNGRDFFEKVKQMPTLISVPFILRSAVLDYIYDGGVNQARTMAEYREIGVPRNGLSYDASVGKFSYAFEDEVDRFVEQLKMISFSGLSKEQAVQRKISYMLARFGDRLEKLNLEFVFKHYFDGYISDTLLQEQLEEWNFRSEEPIFTVQEIRQIVGVANDLLKLDPAMYSALKNGHEVKASDAAMNDASVGSGGVIYERDSWNKMHLAIAEPPETMTVRPWGPGYAVFLPQPMITAELYRNLGEVLKVHYEDDNDAFKKPMIIYVHHGNLALHLPEMLVENVLMKEPAFAGRNPKDFNILIRGIESLEDLNTPVRLPHPVVPQKIPVIQTPEEMRVLLHEIKELRLELKDKQISREYLEMQREIEEMEKMVKAFAGAQAWEKNRFYHLNEDPTLETLYRDVMGDRAMHHSDLTPGGIDLTPARMDVETKREGGGNEKGSIRFHINPAMLAELRNAPGFTAVIINMHPMNLRQFLGINHVSG